MTSARPTTARDTTATEQTQIEEMLVKLSMENVHALRVPLVVDVGVGASWAECKEP